MWEQPDFLSASWYGGAAVLKMASLEESLESLLLTPFGMALMMLGGGSVVTVPVDVL